MDVPGYPRLAKAMAAHPSMMMFSTFSNLNVKSLLYYEAELERLQRQLSNLEVNDWKSWRTAHNDHHIDFWALIHTLRETSDPEGAEPSQSESGRRDSNSSIFSHNEHLTSQWDVICRIRVILKEYYEALHHQIQIQDIYQPPDRKDLKNLCTWLEDGRLGASFLAGNPEDMWDRENGITEGHFVRVTDTGDSLSNLLASLVTVGPSRLRDLRARVLRVFRKDKKPSADMEMNSPARTISEPDTSVEYSANGPSKTLPPSSPTAASITASSTNEPTSDLVKSLTSAQYQLIIHSVLTVLSSSLPVLPIVILYIVKNQNIRVGLVFVFTVILAAIVTFGLNMKAEKVLAITTAFAAVQVVFIATNTNTNA